MYFEQISDYIIYLYPKHNFIYYIDNTINPNHVNNVNNIDNDINDFSVENIVDELDENDLMMDHDDEYCKCNGCEKN